MAGEKSGYDLLRVPAFNVEVREKSFFFSLPNSAGRYHTGKKVATFNVDTQEFRVSRWAIEKSAELWGVRIEEDNTVTIIYPDETDFPTPMQHDPNAVELVDKITHDIKAIVHDLKTLRKLLK